MDGNGCAVRLSLKDNAKYEVQGEALLEKKLAKDEFGVYKVEHIHINYSETVEVEMGSNRRQKRLPETFKNPK